MKGHVMNAVMGSVKERNEALEEIFMAAAAQNIKRLVRFLSPGPQPPLPATA